MDSGTVVAGGATDPDDLYIAPTVLVDVSPDSPIMQDEVFGPVLPVLEIDSVEKVIEWVNERPEPLGLYIFSSDDDVTERILDATNSGDVCVNDCAVHPLVPELPFGGVGNSGMGKYHGRSGSRRSRTPAVCSTTAPSSTPASSTRPTPGTARNESSWTS